MQVQDLGLISYQDALLHQQECVEKVASGAEDIFLVCRHEPVVTLGRGTKSGDVFGWPGPVIETSRGGRATYHGPSQIVVYPILNLTRDRKHLVSRDVHAYLRALEDIIVQTLREFGVEAEARTVIAEAGDLSLTGVWVRDGKMASIGIAIKKWVTYHGLALNVEDDPEAFMGINPCGFKREAMTCLERHVDHFDRTDLQNKLIAKCLERLS